MTVGTETLRLQESHPKVRAGTRKNRIVPLLVELDNDPGAFDRLYRRYYDDVFRYCVHRLFNRTVAMDVTSEIFLKVVKNIRRFRGDEQVFRGWLFRIASNTINSYLRDKFKQKKLLQAAAEYAASNPESPQDSGDEKGARLTLLARAQLALKPRYQMVITLRFFEKMSYTEIAGILGSSEATARSRVSRALVQLRKKMTAFEKLTTPEV